jgi:hypothetical protein
MISCWQSVHVRVPAWCSNIACVLGRMFANAQANVRAPECTHSLLFFFHPLVTTCKSVCRTVDDKQNNTH